MEPYVIFIKFFLKTMQINNQKEFKIFIFYLRYHKIFLYKHKFLQNKYELYLKEHKINKSCKTWYCIYCIC